MATITLPLTHYDLPLQAAFDVMEEAGLSGIVWQRSGKEYRLYRAAEVVIGIARGRERLAQLTGEKMAAGTAEPKWYGILSTHHPESLPLAMSFLVSDVLFNVLNVKAEQCYCPSCGLGGERGKPCDADGTIVECK